MKLKCITICQPYAWAVIHGPKRIENRSWRIHHRGWLAIHAGKDRSLSRPSINGLMMINDGSCVPQNELIYGAVIGLVKVVNCVDPRDARVAGNPFAEGPWCHVYDDPRPLLRPFEIGGQQGLWDVEIPDELITGERASGCEERGATTQRTPANPGTRAPGTRGCRVVDLPGGGRAFSCRR